MRFGICAAADQAQAMAALGYDYLEGNLAELADISEAEVERRRRLLERVGIRQEVFNSFFPGHMKLVGEGRDLEAIRDYAARALERAARLGGRLAVLGSGSARRVPEGMSRDEGETRFAEVACVLGDEAEKVGLCMVLEPLCHQETNLLNTLEEGARFCRRLAHPRVGCLADLFHMVANAEEPEALAGLDGPLWHVHICNPKGRLCPHPDDAYDYSAFVRALEQRGYDKRVSIEAIFQDFHADAAAGLETLRHITAA